MLRRPIQKRILTFLAESDDGLDNLIRQNTRSLRVLKVEKRLVNPYAQIAGHVAKVTVLA